MQKKKLISLLAVATLFTGAGIGFTNNTPTIQAASKTKTHYKNTKKPTVKIKKLSRVYKVRFSKANTYVTKITKMSSKHGLTTFKVATVNPLWSIKQGKTTYYYLGNSVAVRAKDTTRISKKKVPSLTSIVKKQQAYNKKLQTWKEKIQALEPVAQSAKVNKSSVYWVLDSAKGTFNKAQDTLSANTPVKIFFKSDSLLTSNGNNATSYFSKLNDGRQVLIPASYVTLDDPTKESLLPDQESYIAKLNELKKLYSDAKQSLGIN